MGKNCVQGSVEHAESCVKKLKWITSWDFEGKKIKKSCAFGRIRGWAMRRQKKIHKNLWMIRMGNKQFFKDMGIELNDCEHLLVRGILVHENSLAATSICPKEKTSEAGSLSDKSWF